MSGVFAVTSGGDTLHILEQLFLVLGLSMDGFAASVCMGMAAGEGIHRRRDKYLIVTLVSGCHVGMVLLGCWLGAGFRQWMEEFYPWLAAALLLGLGANMLRTAGEERACCLGIGVGAMVTLSLATSLDALTVGVAFSLMKVPALQAGCLTAAVMGTLSLVGAYFGSAVGQGHRKTARLAGGLILCVLGLRLLMSALGALAV